MGEGVPRRFGYRLLGGRTVAAVTTVSQVVVLALMFSRIGSSGDGLTRALGSGIAVVALAPLVYWSWFRVVHEVSVENGTLIRWHGLLRSGETDVDRVKAIRVDLNGLHIDLVGCPRVNVVSRKVALRHFVQRLSALVPEARTRVPDSWENAPPAWGNSGYFEEW